MTDLISKIKKLKNSIKDTDIQINSQEMQNTLNQLKEKANKIQNEELKKVSFNIIRCIEKTTDLKMQIVMLNMWKNLIEKLNSKIH